MSEYGSVRQFKERLREALAVHGAFVVAVSCFTCVATQRVCAECKPEQEAWVDRALGEAGRIANLNDVEPEELLRAVRS